MVKGRSRSHHDQHGCKGRPDRWANAKPPGTVPPVRPSLGHRACGAAAFASQTRLRIRAQLGERKQGRSEPKPRQRPRTVIVSSPLVPYQRTTIDAKYKTKTSRNRESVEMPLFAQPDMANPVRYTSPSVCVFVLVCRVNLNKTHPGAPGVLTQLTRVAWFAGRTVPTSNPRNLTSN